jgi:hypothetical protein
MPVSVPAPEGFDFFGHLLASPLGLGGQPNVKLANLNFAL